MSEKIGRNSPCSCGSGKKFKKCCGGRVAQAVEAVLAPMPEDMLTGTKLDLYFQVFQTVMLYAETLKSSPEFGTQLRRLSRDFEEKFRPGEDDGLPDSFYMNWFALDIRFGDDQRTIIERMMGDNGVPPPNDAVAGALRELADTYATCYEIKEVRDADILFEELVTGLQWTVHRMNDECDADARKRDIWHARFVGAPDNAFYFGLPFAFPAAAKKDFIKITEMLIKKFREYASTRSLKFVLPRDAFKAGNWFWAEYLSQGSSGGSDVPAGEHEESPALPALSTTDGEKLRFSQVIFTILSDIGIGDKLSGILGLEPDNEPHSWVWLKKGNRRMKSWDNTVLGRVCIRGKKLVGETVSLERAMRLKNKLSAGLGESVVFECINSKDARAMPAPSAEQARKVEEEERRLHADPKVREMLVKKLRQYYLKDWISSRIPALGNKTPLQAVKTEKGRLQLEALINRMEGMSNAQPDHMPQFDMNILRAKLGLPQAVRE